MFDPYSIAISKIDRGFETDLQDVLFLIQRELIGFDQLAQYAEIVVQQSREYDINAKEFRQHLAALKKMIG